MHGMRIKPAPIQIILATTYADDHETFESLLAGSPWELVGVASVADALDALHRVTVPIVFCDRDLDRQPWQQTVRALIKARRRTSVTVLTNSSGPGLWAELARRGGFDLLARPFEKEQVYATLLCAYAQCRMGSPVITARRSFPVTSLSI